MIEDKFTSSPEEIASFMKTSVYEDFLKEISIRVTMRRNELEDGELIGTGRHYDLIRGGLKTLREMEDVFQTIMFASEADMRKESTLED